VNVAKWEMANGNMAKRENGEMAKWAYGKMGM
jgi:hypothetical protein